MSLKKDDRAKVKNVAPEGVIEAVKYDENTGEKWLLLAWVDLQGESQKRWFRENELELAAGN